ncbi:TonB-dependent receptor [Sphingomonas sanguinis]|uniref:TonB-dependent receptor plug domain-containing protein n=1 Tax=Sphingomonas sanguinis TaxID=33051 RepID=UPI001C595784|nr:TonB-dependent receptor plug domain-containing protein [Sphingomonas sanguinis]QXT36075.1 TonB-dependent receptor [Sphingomonas sanguinis]
MRSIGILLATSCVAAIWAMPVAAQIGQITSGADTDKAKSESQKRAEQQNARLDGGDQGKASETGSNDVVVTGSRIVNPNLASAAPIQAISAQEIKLSGAVNVEDVLNRLPQIVPYAPQADDEGNGTAKVRLRNIGGSGGAALVLVDGQRLGGQVATDVNSIPPALIQRIDVLTGGAAAVYGPDALTGVVNFVLKKNFKGLQVDANYGFFNHLNRRNVVTDTAQSRGFAVPLGMTNDGGRATINVTAGTSLLDDRLSLSGYASYRHTDNLPYTSRSTQACHLIQAGIDQPLNCDSTLYSVNGVIQRLSDGALFTNARDGSRNFSPYRNTQDATTDRQNRMDSSYQMLRGNERYNAGGFLSFKMTDWAELYGSYMYTKNTSQGTYSPATAPIFATDNGYQLNCNNPLMSAQQAQILCGAAAGTSATVPIDFGYRFAKLATQTIDYQQFYHRATLGVRGDFGGAWHYDVGGVWAKALIKSSINRNWDPSLDNIAKALNVVNVNGVPTCVSKVNGTDPNCVPLDIFQGGNSDLASYNYIFQYAPNGPTRNVSYFLDGQANISGDLGHYGIRSPLAADGVQVSFGAEIRHDIANNFTSADYNSIIQNTPNPSSSARGTQTAKELAAEIQVPLVQDKPWTNLLGVSGGYRASNYDTSSRTFFSTWKLEGTWAPVRDIRFRVARNFASRAPNVFEATQNINFGRNINFRDPCGPGENGAAPLASLQACQLQPGFQASTYGSAYLNCPQEGCIYRFGAVDPKLGPQTANTLTYGLVLTPRFLPRFSFSVDHYEIRYTNQIVGLDQDSIVGNCIGYATDPTELNRISCQQFVRNGDGRLFGNINSPNSGFVSSLVLNVPNQTGTTGYDFQAHYDLPVASGTFATDFNGGIVNSAASVSNQSGNVGYFGDGVGNPIPKWRHNLRGTFTGAEGVFQVSLNWRYISGTTSGTLRDPTKVQKTFAHIPAYSYFDLAANVNIAKRMTLGVTINNLLDKDPPIIPARGGYGQYSINGWQNSPVNFYDIYGRYIQFSVTTNF